MERRSPADTKSPVTDAEWRAQLTPLQYNVTRKRGTERANSGECLAVTLPGVYRCAGCDTPLFGSAAKFDAGFGWPAYRAPLTPECIRTTEDHAWFQRRIEVSCAICDAHLGHLVDDDATPDSSHYCINSVALKFEPAGN